MTDIVTKIHYFNISDGKTEVNETTQINRVADHLYSFSKYDFDIGQNIDFTYKKYVNSFNKVLTQTGGEIDILAVVKENRLKKKKTRIYEDGSWALILELSQDKHEDIGEKLTRQAGLLFKSIYSLPRPLHTAINRVSMVEVNGKNGNNVDIEYLGKNGSLPIGYASLEDFKNIDETHFMKTMKKIQVDFDSILNYRKHELSWNT